MIKLPQNIEYIITDFDGVMTDGCIYIPNNSKDYAKKLNFKDIMAVSIAIKNGYKVGIVSGEDCGAIEYITEKFQLDEVHTNIRNKLEVVKSLIKRNNLNPAKIIYIGDDVNDIETLKFVGYPITVKNAIKSVLDIPKIQITENEGGNGAFREVIDSLIS